MRKRLEKTLFVGRRRVDIGALLRMHVQTACGECILWTGETVRAQAMRHGDKWSIVWMQRVIDGDKIEDAGASFVRKNDVVEFARKKYDRKKVLQKTSARGYE